MMNEVMDVNLLTLGLEKRDIEMVKLLSNGLTVKEAAIQLKMNIRTAETRVSKLREKTETKTLVELGCYFLRKHIID